MVRKVLVSFLVLVIWGSDLFSEMEPWQNYLVVLIHGQGGDHRSLTEGCDDDESPYGDVMKYIEGLYGIDGGPNKDRQYGSYVHCYYFRKSEPGVYLRDIRVEARELGDRNYDNLGAIGLDTSGKPKKKSIFYEIERDSSNQGNCWLEQAEGAPGSRVRGFRGDLQFPREFGIR